MTREVPLRLPAARTSTPRDVARLEVHTTGLVGDEERDCLHGMIRAVLTHHRTVVDHVKARLTGSNCAGGPALVQVNLRVCGAPARIQVAGRGSAQAIATAVARLERQIRRLSTAWEPWLWPDPERRVLGLPGEGAIA